MAGGNSLQGQVCVCMFFFFLKPWADNGSTNQYSCQLFYGRGCTPRALSVSKMRIVGQGPGETPSA